ncbi:hypothetical protein COCMIDRAFT_27416 [Bipolaris oryzae ATCC 44560]|uniref:Secreted protein n=1 Tax=Bipolaris oryzae ATCC 44560 TaxID=930090 RepID=W6ZKZ6_COCMI|nr:uncharacterized protein COCMIDRAFT_27416 [Bipolaris oryzae ATCC 44560]EUC44266.1 hypothetical protein COCMIDRAFT_27416 [Bipolaris oryzae ATCC 44560]
MILNLNNILLLLAATGSIQAGIIRANEDIDKRAPEPARVGPRQPQDTEVIKITRPFISSFATQIHTYVAMVMTSTRTNAGCVVLHGMVAYPKLMEQRTALKNSL